MPVGWEGYGSSDSSYLEGTDVWLIKVEGENLPPDKPIIDGIKKVKSCIEYNYTFVTTDIDGDSVYYYIDWNDNSTEEWIGPYASGLEVTVNHTWEEKGFYTIKAKAKDIYGSESDWAYFYLEVPRSKEKANLFFNWLLDRFKILVRLIFPVY